MCRGRGLNVKIEILILLIRFFRFIFLRFEARFILRGLFDYFMGQDVKIGFTFFIFLFFGHALCITLEWTEIKKD